MDHNDKETYKDYRICHKAMGAGHDKDREYLSNKYSVPCNNVADLWRLAGRLFAGLSDAAKRTDKADAEAQLNLAASTMGRKGGKSKSDAKTAAARENGRQGGRPKYIRTLRELIDEHDANGVVMIDAGNGSAGPRWLPAENIDEDMLSLSMFRHMSAPANRDARSATGDDKYIVRWASDWIEDDDRGGDFETQNPWRYKLLF